MKCLGPISALIVCTCHMSCQSVNMRSSEETITRAVLRELPIGSEMAQVEAWLNAQGWRIIHKAEDHGFWKEEPGEAPVKIGAKSIGANAGAYADFPPNLRTGVQVFFGFDKDGKLVGIWVRKTSGAL